MSSNVPSSENEIAMKSGGVDDYNSNSSVQNLAIHRALPLFPDLSSHPPSSPLTVVDYGSGPAGNSFFPLKALLSTLPAGATVNVVLNDRPYNDWNAASAVLKEGYDDLTRGGALEIYVTMSPRSFFHQVMPPASVDIGFSWSSFNYLEHQLPPPPASSFDELVEKRLERNAKQAHIDLVKLLKLRAVEIKASGTFIAALTASNSPNGPWALVGAMKRALTDACADGTLTEAQLRALEPAMHERSEEELQKALSEVTDVWEMTYCQREMIAHPAWDTLQASPKTREDYEEYGEQAAAWGLAVISWYLVRALRTGAGFEEGERGPQRPVSVEEEGVLARIKEKMKGYFVGEFKDVPVGVEYLIFKLVRK